jgi:hypothetical protein
MIRSERGKDMTQRRSRIMFALAALIAVLLTGCGGGGEGASTQSAGTGTQTLAWDPPQTYVDNSPMDPYQELDYYEFYVSSDPNFTDNEAPVAQVAAISNVLNPDGHSYTQTLTSEFSLDNLLPFTQQGAVYYISIRSVSLGGLKSNFSTPVTWNLI